MPAMPVHDAETGRAQSSDSEEMMAEPVVRQWSRRALAVAGGVGLAIACIIALTWVWPSGEHVKTEEIPDADFKEAQAILESHDIVEYLSSDMARLATGTGKDAIVTEEGVLESIARDKPSVNHDLLQDPVVDCHVSEWEQCPLSNMMGRTTFTNVFPGGKTRCILSTHSDYSFQVLPGDSSKVMIYFQGGGSCWDEASTKMKLCTQEVVVNPLVGIFDRKDANNPYNDYTIIHVGYCSGDAHGGDAARNFTGPGGAEVEQRGFENAMAAVNWTKANLGAKKLESFVISGTSAGSLGAQLWARKLLSEFSYESAAVLADSYIGVIPTEVQGAMQRHLGVCQTGLLSDAMTERCYAGNLTVEDTYSEAMSEFPDVAFASINSKVDAVQMAFYDAVQMSIMGGKRLITPTEFYAKMSTIQGFYSRHANHVTFDVNTMNHTFINTPHIHNTHAGNESLGSWLHNLPVRPGQSIGSKCDGPCVPHVNTKVFIRSLPASPSVTEGAKNRTSNGTVNGQEEWADGGGVDEQPGDGGDVAPDGDEIPPPEELEE